MPIDNDGDGNRNDTDSNGNGGGGGDSEFQVLDARVADDSKTIRKVKRRYPKFLSTTSPKMSPFMAEVSTLLKRKLFSEAFRPAFSGRELFCESRFRDHPSRDGKVTSGTNPLLKIIDGSETQVNEFPWMLSLQLSGQHFCGASLISQEWVLTAAHCLELSAENFLERLVVSSKSFNAFFHFKFVFKKR